MSDPANPVSTASPVSTANPVSTAVPPSGTANSGRFRTDRQREIYLLALKNGSVEVADLAQRFDVTTETIRRDLSDLQERGQLERVHGGAISLEPSSHIPTVDARDMLNAAEKLRIGEAAADEVPVDGSVFIDSGSTLQRFAEAFPVDRGAHVVTNSLIVAVTLSRRGNTNLTVLGGSVRTATFAMVDSSTIDAIRDLRADVAFVSCDGLSLQRGLTTPYRDEAAVKSAMIAGARKVVALVDSTKFGNSEMFAFAPLGRLDVLITDDRVDSLSVEVLIDAGIDVRVV